MVMKKVNNRPNNRKNLARFFVLYLQVHLQRVLWLATFTLHNKTQVFIHPSKVELKRVLQSPSSFIIQIGLCDTRFIIHLISTKHEFWEDFLSD